MALSSPWVGRRPMRTHNPVPSVIVCCRQLSSRAIQSRTAPIRRQQEVLVRSFICAALLVATSLAAAQQTSSSSIDVKSKMDEGAAAFRAHDYKRALSIFNEVTAADPNNIMAHNLAGNCSMEMRDFPG